MKRAWSCVLMLALCASCSGGSTAATKTPAPSGRPSSTATLTIEAPRNGESVQGPTIHMRFGLTGAKIVPQVSTNLRPDEGHLHVLLDGRLVTMTSATTEDLRDVPPGSHVVRAEFVANDHAPFNPRVVANVTFQVR